MDLLKNQIVVLELKNNATTQGCDKKMQTPVILHQFSHPDYIPNFSPFCMKLETYLRMANIPYTVDEAINPSKGPNGKMPFIEVDNKRIPDTSIIIDYFQNNPEYNLDKNLTAQQQALGVLLQRLCEDHLYWGIVYSRWQDPDGFYNHWKHIMSSTLPKPLRFIIYLIRRKALKELYGQGTGRYDKGDVYAFCSKDIQTLNVYLSKAKPFLFGEHPSTFDACVYGTVGSLLFTPWDFPLKSLAMQFKSFKQFYNHITSLYFPTFPTSD